MEAYKMVEGCDYFDWSTLQVNDDGDKVRFVFSEAAYGYDPFSEETPAFHLHWMSEGQVKMTRVLCGMPSKRYVAHHCPLCGFRMKMSEGAKSPKELWEEFATLNPQYPRREYIG